METLTELDKNQNVNVAQSVYDEPNFTIPNTSSKQIHGCYFSSGFAVSHLNVNNFMNLGPI